MTRQEVLIVIILVAVFGFGFIGFAWATDPTFYP